LYAPFNHPDWLFELTCDERHGANRLDDREKLQEVYHACRNAFGRAGNERESQDNRANGTGRDVNALPREVVK